MAKKIILHLGLHKTATTSLQEFLANHNAALLRQSVHYIPLQRMRTDVTHLIAATDRFRRGIDLQRKFARCG